MDEQLKRWRVDNEAEYLRLPDLFRAPLVPLLLIAIALTLSLALESQQTRKAIPKQGRTPQLIEITNQDFTKLDELRSTRLTVFGVHLGQTKDEAKAAAESAGLNWKIDGNYGHLYGRDGHYLAALEISSDASITTIFLERDIAPYLAGDAGKLFSGDALDPTSSVRLGLLGREDQYEREPWETLALESRHFRYFKEGIEIVGQFPTSEAPGAIRVRLFVPAKQRQ